MCQAARYAIDPARRHGFQTAPVTFVTSTAAGDGAVFFQHPVKGSQRGMVNEPGAARFIQDPERFEASGISATAAKNGAVQNDVATNEGAHEKVDTVALLRKIPEDSFRTAGCCPILLDQDGRWQYRCELALCVEFAPGVHLGLRGIKVVSPLQKLRWHRHACSGDPGFADTCRPQKARQG